MPCVGVDTGHDGGAGGAVFLYDALGGCEVGVDGGSGDDFGGASMMAAATPA